jgi:hypothetical protein
MSYTISLPKTYINEIKNLKHVFEYQEDKNIYRFISLEEIYEKIHKGIIEDEQKELEDKQKELEKKRDWLLVLLNVKKLKITIPMREDMMKYKIIYDKENNTYIKKNMNDIINYNKEMIYNKNKYVEMINEPY